MTDRFNSLTVVLEADIRDDDAQALLSAISQLRGVLKVSGNVSDLEAHVAMTRARHEIEQKLWAAFRSESSTR